MKIVRVETFLVPPRWLFVRVETDEGVAGWGEPVLEGRAGTVRTAVHELAELLAGADPLRIEDNWQLLTKGAFYRGGPILASAVAGIDQALWDIAGKVRGAAVHELLGGPVRERVRMYAWVAGDDAASIADSAARAVAHGLTAVKLLGCPGTLGPIDTPAQTDLLLRRVAAVREVLGPERDVAIDFHGRFSPAMARRVLPLLEPFEPLFVEEPVLPEFGHLLPEIVAGTSIPIATGERLFSRGDFLPALQAGIAVAQPDLSHAGGISEVRRIAVVAETFGASLAPHCPLGPLALASSLQVDLASPNFLVQEQALGLEADGGSEVLAGLVDEQPFTMVDGHLLRPRGPGLGIEVDEQAVRRAAQIGHSYRITPWRHPDGSLAEL
ncbi:galactonate dehydratase [Actinopolymorpha rutila]|uniref:Galactonate dehydratase n=1 Tax=Actinopolymorpha rutila TaxID=446787 RepID=A0A852ZJH8_9ACTN|nr:galactonate dehydratase [Actinopolymorpha rutila]NYH92285.1 galactonate dehydratase [Actinopolymorpha rutila]